VAVLDSWKRRRWTLEQRFGFDAMILFRAHPSQVTRVVVEPGKSFAEH
jgi:hypothetical protein